MKKLLALLMVVAMLICMVACAKENDDETTLGCEEEEITTLDTNEESESESESEEAEEVTEDPSEEASGGILSGIVGKTEGNRYENELLGLGIELDSTWTVYDEDQIAQLMGVTADLINDESIAQIVENSGTAFLYYAVSTAGASVNIVLENTSAYSNINTADDYIEASLSLLESGLSSAGFENLVIDKSEIDFMGEKHSAIIVESTVGGIAVYEVLVPIVLENSVAVITIATTTTNTCADILAQFYSVAK